MKRLLVIALFMLFGMATIAQDCYTSTRKQGIDYYNQGKKIEAKRYFVAAQSCPDKPANNDLQSWINKCNVSASTQKNAPETTVSVKNVNLVNTETGEIVNPPIYSGDMSNIAPRIYYSGTTSNTTKITLHTKLIDPKDKTIRNSSSPSGYTSLRNVSLMANVRDSVTMPSLLNYNNGVYANGEYTYEVYYQGTLLYSRKFSVVSDRPKLVINGIERGAISTSDLSYQGGPVIYSIEANDSYEVVNNTNWISIRSRSQNRLEIMVSENPNEYGRNDFLLVKIPGLQRTITIQQAGRPPKKITESAVATQTSAPSKPKIEMGASFLLTMTSTSFSTKSTQSVINYGVNDLDRCYTDPDYKSGIGFNVFANYYHPIVNHFYLGTGIGISNGGFSNKFKSDNWRFSSGGKDWYPVQQSQETYRLTYLDIPIRAAYELQLGNNSSMMFKGGFIIAFGLSGVCKVESTIHEESETDAQGNYSYRDNKLTGSVNLFSGKYTFDQKYSTGAASNYSIDGTAENPYNRVNFSLNLGADISLNKIVVGVEYNLGLSNIANSKYWGDVERQVPGFYLVGDPKFYTTTNELSGYKQRLSSLAVKLSFTF